MRQAESRRTRIPRKGRAKGRARGREEPGGRLKTTKRVQGESQEEIIGNYIGGDLTHVNDFCKTILETIEVSSILKLPEALHDPLMAKS